MLDSLSLSRLRIVDMVRLDLGCDLTVITGPNGSGKTSLLEGIHLLATGRSFRSRSAIDVIQRGQEAATVTARVNDVAGRAVHMGIERRRQGPARLRLDGQTLGGLAELARRLPVVTITPDGQRLLTDGSEGRRRLLDWLMFHVEPTYAEVHGRFRQVLRQRNAAIRGGPGQWEVRETWDAELAAAGMAVQRLRDRHSGTIADGLERLLAEISAVKVAVALQPGWPRDGGDLDAVLARHWTQDLARGFTTVGPHRADLSFQVEGRLARDVLSRGESKLVTVGLQIALARLLSEIRAVNPVILVDELASELDASNRARFFATLRETGCQTLVTAVDPDLVDGAGWATRVRVEMHRGKARQVLQ